MKPVRYRGQTIGWLVLYKDGSLLYMSARLLYEKHYGQIDNYSVWLLPKISVTGPRIDELARDPQP